jgi:hypothetical protein
MALPGPNPPKVVLTPFMNLLNILLFKDSRKVAFGLWLFIVCNVWLFLKLINSDEWMFVVALCSGLVGGGTVMDAYLRTKTSKAPNDAPKV